MPVNNYEAENYFGQNQRFLDNIPDARKSIVLGFETFNMNKLEPKTITVKSRDKHGSIIDTGGSILYVLITNHWEMISTYECVLVSNATRTLSKHVFERMVDNNDGTYSYTFSIQNTGMISISIIQIRNGLMLEYSALKHNGSNDNKVIERDDSESKPMHQHEVRNTSVFYTETHIISQHLNQQNSS